MDDNQNFRLLYELNAKESQLELSIQQVEQQLKNVNKRLDSLWYDLKLFTGLFIAQLLIGRLIIFLATNSVVSNSAGAIIFVLVQFINMIRLVSSWFLIPINVVLIAKSLALIIENRETNADVTPPPLEGELRGELPEREKNYRSEQKKLIYVLSRYYAQQDVLKQLRQQLESDPESMTLAELKFQLNKLSVYEQVRPANPNLRKNKQ